MSGESNNTANTLSKSQEESAPEELQGLITESCSSGLAAVNFKNLQWTQKDINLIVLMTMINFGDALEIYLPGVITQSASSDMEISETQEGLLGIILYLCLAFSFFILPAIKNKVGRTSALLVSLYTSIIATIFCSLVPNFWTLLLSRALIGLCIGLNWSVGSLYFAERVSSYEMYNVGKLCGLFAFTLGGGWVAVLGYILLSRIGWRYFIVCTSVPVFIPPICILHFSLAEDTTEDEVKIQTDKVTESDVIRVNNFWGRLIKGCVTNFINKLQGWGSILLIPALLTYLDDQQNVLTMDQELLILALLYGGAKLLGRVVGVFLLKYVTFRILQPLLSVIIASCYLALIFWDNSLTAIVGAMGIANMCFCVTRCELTLMEFDKHYFGTGRLDLAGGVMAGCGLLGATVGAIAAQFLSSQRAVVVSFVLSCVQVVAFCCITDR